MTLTDIIVSFVTSNYKPKIMYQTPVKGIYINSDHQEFCLSNTYAEFLVFIKQLNISVRGKKISSDYKVSENAMKIIELIQTLDLWVNEIPPTDQPTRFGNKAYRTWFDRLAENCEDLHVKMLPESLHNAIQELAPYLNDSFGNRTRIDYGTGHETNFFVWIYCLYKLGFVKQEDFPAIVLRVFTTYLVLTRHMQVLYMLEPAGSHGVWGLDDYQCLVFYFGSSQLQEQDLIKPSSIHDRQILLNYKDEYMYLAAIQFILDVKKGCPFFESSPMLNDISGVPFWEKINSGMLKLYEGEVLKKYPVIQHLLFGTLFPCTWTPTKIEKKKCDEHKHQHLPPGIKLNGVNEDLDGIACCRVPWSE